MTTRFDRDTAVAPDGDGHYRVRIDGGWSVIHPNGGYIAALVLRALEHAVGDPARVPRSFTLHYTRPLREGPARVETRIERSGRSLTTLSGRLVQDDQHAALALAAFSTPRPGYAFDEARLPEVPPPEACPPLAGPKPLAIRDRYEQRWALGTQPFAGGGRARAGGWIRLEEPRLVDAALLAAYTDAFPPAVFSRAQRDDIKLGVPTIDLSIHFRVALPLADARPDDFCLAVFQSRMARDGFLEEDGEIWARDGTLLAHSRQLAVVG